MITPRGHILGSRWRDVRDGDVWASIPFSLNFTPMAAIRGQFQAGLCRVMKQVSVEVVKRSDTAEGVAVLTQTLDRRADHRLAKPVQKACQGLGMPEAQRSGIPRLGLHPSCCESF